MPAPKREKAAIRPDILKAIRRVWPHGVVEMAFDIEDSYFHEIYPRLKKDLSRIKQATLLHELEANAEPRRSDESDWHDEPPDWDDEPSDFNEDSRSYHLFFLTPKGEGFTAKVETEELDDDRFGDEEFDDEEIGDENDHDRVVSGESTYGCSVGVSLVAPFAIVTFGEMTHFEDGSTAEPALGLHLQSMAGETIGAEEHFREIFQEKKMQVLDRLQGEIAGILQLQGITVLPQDESEKTVRRLRGGEETFLTHQPLTVKDAFFFEGV